MVRISTAFESGNIGQWMLADVRQLHFHAPTDGAPWAMWFYFRLEDAGPGRFEFVVANLTELLEHTHWGDVRPVMRVAASDWIQARPEDVALDLARSEFRFSFDLPDAPVEIAYSYPYPPSRGDELIRALQTAPNVEVSYPGMSAAGRAIPYIILRCADSEVNRPVIWAQSREHAGEVSGAYTLDGFLRAAATSPLRERYEIHALPMAS